MWENRYIQAFQEEKIQHQLPGIDEVMVPKESAQIQDYRFHNKDTTLNSEPVHNSNLKKE